MKKYKNKYRIASARAQWWDYGANGLYFVTICCHNRVCWFGNVVDGKMILSKIGGIAEKCWIEIPEHFPFVKLHHHIIMPNHVHGIIEIAKTGDGITDDAVTVETQDFASLPSNPTPPANANPTPQPKNQFGPQSKNLASIIRGFKIGVTKNARQFNPDFQWQARSHDIIIRDEKSYCNISNYIEKNPINWETDKFHSL